METLKKRLEEQKGRHQGGNKWIGTGGTSPFGAYGYNPEGIRIGQDESRAPPRGQGLGQARVPEPRRHASSSARATSRSRCAGCASSRARARAEELDLDDTIRSTAQQRRLARPQDGPGAAQRGQGAAVPRCRRLDGRSHPRSARSCSRPRAPSSSTSNISTSTTASTSACGSDNRRRHGRTHADAGTCCTPMPHDYKVIFVGDATMSPYEITYPGGSVEHWNEEAGRSGCSGCCSTYSRSIWLNPAAPELLELHREHPHPPAPDGRPDVSPDARRPGRRHEGAQPLSR